MNTQKSNVIPIRKADKFNLTTGLLNQDSTISEVDQVGYAYLKPGGKTFRLKFWMFPKESYFLSRDADSDSTYTILSMEEYTSSNLDPKTVWREIGKGYVMGNYIRLDFHLIKKEIYLSLFPDVQEVADVVSF